jgi:hypothetical protein
MTESEVIEIISDVTTMFGDILSQHISLNESLVGAGVEAQQLKVDTLKARLASEKLRLEKLKDAAKRKRELEKANKRIGAGDVTNEAKAPSPPVQVKHADPQLLISPAREPIRCSSRGVPPPS